MSKPFDVHRFQKLVIDYVFGIKHRNEVSTYNSFDRHEVYHIYVNYFAKPIAGEYSDSLSNGPSRKGSTFSVAMPSGRANSITPSSSQQHNLNNVNADDSIHELNRTHESDRTSIPSNYPYHTGQKPKSSHLHHHSLDRDGNNKMYPDISMRHYNTNPKPHNANCQQLKNVVKSRSNQSNSSMSKYDGHATASINGSDECLNGDRLSISSHCSSSTATVADLHAAKSRSASRLSKHSCKKHHNGA